MRRITVVDMAILVVLVVAVLGLAYRYLPAAPFKAIDTQNVTVNAPSSLPPGPPFGLKRPLVHMTGAETEGIDVTFHTCNGDGNIVVQGTFEWTLWNGHVVKTVIPDKTLSPSGSATQFILPSGCGNTEFVFPITPDVTKELESQAKQGNKVTTWELTGTSKAVHPDAVRGPWNTQLFYIEFDS